MVKVKNVSCTNRSKKRFLTSLWCEEKALGTACLRLPRNSIFRDFAQKFRCPLKRGFRCKKSDLHFSKFYFEFRKLKFRFPTPKINLRHLRSSGFIQIFSVFPILPIPLRFSPFRNCFPFSLPTAKERHIFFETLWCRAKCEKGTTSSFELLSQRSVPCFVSQNQLLVFFSQSFFYKIFTPKIAKLKKNLIILGCPVSSWPFATKNLFHYNTKLSNGYSSK